MHEAVRLNGNMITNERLYKRVHKKVSTKQKEDSHSTPPTAKHVHYSEPADITRDGVLMTKRKRERQRER